MQASNDVAQSSSTTHCDQHHHLSTIVPGRLADIYNPRSKTEKAKVYQDARELAAMRGIEIVVKV